MACRDALLVTGATGLLGSHFVLDTVRRGRAVVALVRDGDAPPWTRLVAALRSAAVVCGQPVEEDLWRERIRVLCGDVTRGGVFADAAARDVLGGLEVTECWHFAATLRFREHQRRDVLATNVAGSERLVRAAHRIGVHRFVHVSSAYAAGRLRGEVREELVPPEVGHDNVYDESKCRAEWAVTATCSALDLPCVVLRPSVVVGHAQTLRGGNNRRGFYGFLRELYLLRATIVEQERLRLVADPTVGIDLVPVDAVLADIRFLVDHGFPGGPIHHLTGGRTHAVGYLFAMACEALGIVPPEFVATESELRSPLDRIVHERTLFYRTYLLRPKRFVRTLPGEPAPNRMQLEGMTRAYLRELGRETYESVLPRCGVESRDGIVLNAYADRDAGAPDVILCNAYGMPMEFWKPVTRRLVPHFRVASWESRFVPIAGGPFAPERAGLEWHLHDLEAVLEATAAERPILIGWSTGARLALRYALARPERVAGLVLLNGSYNFPDGFGASAPTMTLVELARRIVADPRYATIYHRWVFQGDGDDTSEESWTARKRISEILGQTDPELIHLLNTPWRTVESMTRFAHMFACYYDVVDAVADFTRIACPTLVVASENDAFASPEASAHVARHIPGAQYACVADGDHYALYTRPEVAAWIENFCRRVDVRRPCTEPAS